MSGFEYWYSGKLQNHGGIILSRNIFLQIKNGSASIATGIEEKRYSFPAEKTTSW